VRGYGDIEVPRSRRRLEVVRSAARTLLVGLAVQCAGAGQDCTLKPAQGTKQSALSNGVAGTMTWSACTDLVHDFVFQWPRKEGLPAAGEALRRAAVLLREWRKATKTGSSPFGDLAGAIERRASVSTPYVLGEEFSVTEIPDVPGWDGASVTVTATKQTVQLRIHYWARP